MKCLHFWLNLDVSVKCEDSPVRGRDQSTFYSAVSSVRHCSSVARKNIVALFNGNADMRKWEFANSYKEFKSYSDINTLFDVQPEVMDESINIPLDLLPESELSYEIVPGGAKMGGDLLICPNQYTFSRYSLERPHIWRCSCKGAKKCTAKVHDFLGKNLFILY